MCTLLQRRVLKLDETGVKAKAVRDLVCEADKKGRRYDKAINQYAKRLFLKKNGALM
jgi:hypothetical protein